jgi:hypothetical protein
MPEEKIIIPEKPKEEGFNLVLKANEAAERLERANQERKLILDREEQLEARKRLGGETGLSPQVQKIETPKEYKDRILKGG